MGCNQSTGSKIDPSGGTGIIGNRKIDFKPIHSAVRWNNSYEEVVEYLDTEEQIESRDNGNGNYPIHIAAQNGHHDLVKLLIERKANLNAVNMKGNTAFHMAIEYDYYESCKLLMDAGADITIKNSDGHPAIYGIEGEKNIAVCELYSAKITEDAVNSLKKCLQDMVNIDKVTMAQAGLKVKKSMGAQWTDECQDLFKQVLAKCES